MAQYPFVPSKYGTASHIYGTAATAGTTTIGTPPANSYLRMLTISVTENATTGTAQENMITISLNGNIVFEEPVYSGTSGGGTGGTLYQRVLVFNPLNFTTGATGTLDANLQFAYTAGELIVNAYFD